tara:strand:+ start:111095 stop:112651 length:1557 start_codon:yes stop_codon:yes gene_type:complete
MSERLKHPLYPRDIVGTDRRGLLTLAVGGGLSLMAPFRANAALPEEMKIRKAIASQQDDIISGLQDWIALPSIAAEDRNMAEGAVMMTELLRSAGFQRTSIIPTDGHPGVFATLDAGASRTVAVYFMYDVKQFDASEWSSPPLEARIVDRQGLGKVMIGRGATNQKGPQATFLAALHALRRAGLSSPVNIVLIAEGEEEIGSPNLAQIVHQNGVMESLKACREVWMPKACQTPEGVLDIELGNKGLVEVELTSSSIDWGRGARNDVHSSFKAVLDSPVWRLVKALSTLVSEDGNDPLIDGWFENVQALTVRQKELIADSISRTPEAAFKRKLGAQKWIRDLGYRDAVERLVSQPTVNIEGIVAGYTGPGGKTVLPSRASAKLDLRLVPNQTKAEAVSKLRAHLEKRGYGDIRIEVTGGYNPSQTDENSHLIRSMKTVARQNHIEYALNPRLAGSWPAYIFTEAPLKLAAGHFGLGHGSKQHAPDEYYVIESSNPKVCSLVQATLGNVEFLYALAAISR